ncbi:FAD-dependent monooxygenase [Streptomyces phaeochromogenes]|uniref:FAD-dependent monooxygenase n=1 Tax=Streptomyces phaeochromogenes TaxID=1923 RepID=UPI003676C791
MNPPAAAKRNTSVLVSGASVAGITAAYWLNHHGFDVTVVELAPALRPGGQAIDVRGPALDIAERMGVLDAVRSRSTGLRGMTVEDRDNNETFRTNEVTLSGGTIASPDVEIMRDELIAILHQTTADSVEYLFDDSVTGIRQDEDAVHVTFRNSAPRTFDLVVGADGLHSVVRRLVFGPEEQFTRSTVGNRYIALISIPNFLDLDRWELIHRSENGHWGGVMPVRDNTELRVFVIFLADEPLTYDYRDSEQQKQIVTDHLSGEGWKFPQILDYLKDTSGFHFQAMDQIHMDTWSQGRVALVGDAGFCPSPVSGQSVTVAMVSGYVLAGELAAAAGDHRAAFAGYQDELRGYVADNQELAVTYLAKALADDFEDFGKPVDGLVLKTY